MPNPPPTGAVKKAKAAIRGASRMVGIGGKRRRRGRSGLSFGEMGKLTYMASMLGRNHPLVTLSGMKALGGRL